MNPVTFDEIAKLFATRRLSRRQALAQGGAGLAAAASAVAELGAPAAAASPDAAHAVGDRLPEAAAVAGPPIDGFTVLEVPALGATALATPAATAAKPVTFLFLQSFDTGSLVPKPGTPGRYTLTLTHGLGDTVYFSDRPAKVVGTVPTTQFLNGLGFPPANPPNAALVGPRSPTHKDVVVVELFDPKYDASSNTLTYEVSLLQDWHKLDEQFQETPDNEQQLPRAFTAAHLFIDDCADATPLYCHQSIGWKKVGDLGNQGMCWDWRAFDCVPCMGQFVAAAECDTRFPACDGNCAAYY